MNNIFKISNNYIAFILINLLLIFILTGCADTPKKSIIISSSISNNNTLKKINDIYKEENIRDKYLIPQYHAWQYISNINENIDKFAAYTYILFPYNKDKPNPTYIKLIEAIANGHGFISSTQIESIRIESINTNNKQ